MEAGPAGARDDGTSFGIALMDVHQRPAVLIGDVFPPSPLQKAGQQLERSPRFWSWAEHLPLLVKNESLKNWVNVWGMHCPGRLVMSSLSTVGVLKPALDWRKVKPHAVPATWGSSGSSRTALVRLQH